MQSAKVTGSQQSPPSIPQASFLRLSSQNPSPIQSGIKAPKLHLLNMLSERVVEVCVMPEYKTWLGSRHWQSEQNIVILSVMQQSPPSYPHVSLLFLSSQWKSLFHSSIHSVKVNVDSFLLSNTVPFPTNELYYLLIFKLSWRSPSTCSFAFFLLLLLLHFCKISLNLHSKHFSWLISSFLNSSPGPLGPFHINVNWVKDNNYEK